MSGLHYRIMDTESQPSVTRQFLDILDLSLVSRDVIRSGQFGMAGQALMCVWQLAAVRDNSVSGAPPKSLIRSITSDIAKRPRFKFDRTLFDSRFPGQTVDFDEYRDFVRGDLTDTNTPLSVAEADFENICWEQCKKEYTLGVRLCLTADDKFRLWQMFNRICRPNSCPPVVEPDEMNWWGNKIARPMSKHWIDLPLTSQPLTYSGALKVFNEQLLDRAGQSTAQASIEQLHAWLVREVCMTGWLYKRTRKHQGSWSSWQRRFHVLTPGEIRYYTSERQRDQDMKGKVSINSGTGKESLSDYKGLTRKYPHRFRISNQPNFEMELSGSAEHERKAWMSALEEVIEAIKAGTTPVQAVLASRLSKGVTQRRKTLDDATAKLRSLRLSQPPDTLPPKRQPTRVSRGDDEMEMDYEGDEEDEEIFDNNIYNFEQKKVRGIFDEMDTNGDGQLDCREFNEFVRRLVPATQVMSRGVFADIDEDGDGFISYDEFNTYLNRLLLDQTVDSEVELALRTEFLRADSLGNSALDFKDLSDFVWERRRSYRFRRLMTAFANLDATSGQDQGYSNFREFLEVQFPTVNAVMVGDDQEDTSALTEQLRDLYDVDDIDTLAKWLAEKWPAFVQSKGLAHKGIEEVSKNYTLIDVACDVSTDGEGVRQPRLAVVEGARWEQALVPGQSARLIFPASFDCVVPAETGTTSNLQYFGCRIVDNEREQQVSLLYENTIVNMGYANEGFDRPVIVGMVGPGIERSSHSRFDTPLTAESGFLVLAKWQGDEEALEIAGFTIPTNKNVYIPAGVLYSFDYSKGSWRSTVPQPNTVIEHAHMKRQFVEDNDRDLENVAFQFED